MIKRIPLRYLEESCKGKLGYLQECTPSLAPKCNSFITRTFPRFLPGNTTFGPEEALSPFWGRHRLSDVQLVLLVNDWGGDSVYLKDLFFASLQPNSPTETPGTFQFESGIRLCVKDCIGDDEFISVEEPKRLFYRKGSHLSTTALYYGDDHLCDIGSNEIGGIENLSVRRKKYVRDICSIRLHFPDRKPVYRVFVKHKKKVRVTNIQVEDEFKEKWVTKWRLAGPHEKEWWP
ncbi:hypothetical protein BX600DRAFT_440146 [Xylariales sp. PMI_506]|nr:hypothetical protein BX600DRAFT_440146 [Xylariales sp. PMI_506]